MRSGRLTLVAAIVGGIVAGMLAAAWAGAQGPRPQPPLTSTPTIEGAASNEDDVCTAAVPKRASRDSAGGARYVTLGIASELEDQVPTASPEVAVACEAAAIDRPA